MTEFAEGIPAFVLDTETYPNLFLIGILDYQTDQVRQFSNVSGIGESLDAARHWFSENKDRGLFLGFNNLGYDNIMLRAALVAKLDDPAALYQLSLETIAAKRVRLEQIDSEISVDVLAIHGGQMARIGSLKECGVKSDFTTLQELPYAFDQPLTPEQMIEVAQYNVLDLRITAITATKSRQQILARIALADEFSHPGLLNKHDAGVAVAVLERAMFSDRPSWSKATAWYCQARELTEHFKYRHPALQELHSRIAHWEMDFSLDTETLADGEVEKTVTGPAFADAVTVDGVGYRLGVGGLHSVDEPGIWEADEHYRLIDFDVASFYPSLILNYGLHPQHLPKELFLKAFSGLRDRRLVAKAKGQTALSEGLKISINSVFGKTKSPYSWICDPVMNVAVTILGQLTLLQFVDLVADCGDAIKVVSANTDGLTLRIARDDAADVIQAMHSLAGQHKLTLETTEYRLIARRDVNNYLALKHDGQIKARGAYAYDTENLAKKATERVVIDAVQQYFVAAVPIEQTIQACQDIRAFIDFFKCTKGYCIVAGDGTEHGGIARWYLATGGQHLDKLRLLDGTKTQLVDTGAVVINQMPDCLPSDIAHAAYVAKAERLVRAITEPDLRPSQTIPLTELSIAQTETFHHNLATDDPDPARCDSVDLKAAERDYAASYRGSRYDSMKAIAVRLWLGEAGRLTRGDLLHLCRKLDRDTGYFTKARAKTLTRMCDWIAREISPFALPQTMQEHAARALVWAEEHVVPLTRKKKLIYKGDILDCAIISGETLLKYAKKANVYALACSISAVSIKHDLKLSAEQVARIMHDVHTHVFKQKDRSDEVL